MNKTSLVLLCSSSLFVACGGSDNNRPAQSAYDPQTTSTNAEMPAATTPSPAPQAPSSPTADPMAPSTMGTATPNQTYPSTDTSGAMGSGWGTGSNSNGASSNKNGASPSTGGSSSSSAGNSAATPPSSGSSSATTGAASETSPDNSGVNKRDRSSGAVTPMDQGTSDGERRITANIRKLVVGDKSLSFTAKNVKIITVGTKVTLRGPVKSDQEKTAIEGYARGIAGVTEVDDQLEVKK